MELIFAFLKRVRCTDDTSFHLGKTTCLGTRLAKVELKLITAVFVLAFEHSVIDPLGEPANLLPLPNWNDILLARPPVGSFNLGYERTDVPL